MNWHWRGLAVALAAMALVGCKGGGGLVPTDEVVETLAGEGIDAELDLDRGGDNVLGFTANQSNLSGDYEFVVIKGNDIVAVKEAKDKTKCHLKVKITDNSHTYSCTGKCPGKKKCFMAFEDLGDVGLKIFCRCK